LIETAITGGTASDIHLIFAFNSEKWNIENVNLKVVEKDLITTNHSTARQSTLPSCAVIGWMLEGIQVVTMANV
jgi:hypothetical protein